MRSALFPGKAKHEIVLFEINRLDVQKNFGQIYLEIWVLLPSICISKTALRPGILALGTSGMGFIQWITFIIHYKSHSLLPKGINAQSITTTY